ncbi:MAG: hypothetical protein JWN44_6629 [Myxococcales bacterium]|nr:hypothetical protein [Myxococcales bacterium]
MSRRITILLALSIAAVGCKRRSPSVAPAAASVNTAAAEPARVPGQGAAEAGLEVRAPLVYVDGEARAAFTYNELPSTVKLRAGGHGLVCDYLHDLGADCATVRQIDFHGPAGAIVSVPAAELRRARKTLAFHFTDGTGGKPIVERNGASVAVEDVAVFVQDKPVAGARYAHDDGRRGVRVDVDGRLVGKIKRNLLEGNVEPISQPAAGGIARYRLADYLASKSADVERIRGVDLVLRDERVVRLSASELTAGLEFAAPDKGHGEMIFYFGSQAVKALAVVVWARTEPPTRALRTLVMHAALTP